MCLCISKAICLVVDSTMKTCGVEFYLMGQWHFLFAHNSNAVDRSMSIRMYVCVLIKRVYTLYGNNCATIEVGCFEYCGSYMYLTNNILPYFICNIGRYR